MLPLGAYFLNSWEADLSPVEHTYSAREQSCNATYRDPEARERALLEARARSSVVPQAS